ncbi:MAG: GNAT family N-acetyltransferase [Cryomorphaceae bacterium]
MMEKIELKRVSNDDDDFIALVQLLDADLAFRDGTDNAFYAQFNGPEDLHHAVVLYVAGQAAACGAIKEYDRASAEVKRMFTQPQFRGKKLGAKVLKELENWASDLGYTRCILETGLRQPEAIRLYEREGYERIANYAPYEGVSNSVCFQKRIAPGPADATQ